MTTPQYVAARAVGARFFLQKHFPDSVTFGTERPTAAVLYFPRHEQEPFQQPLVAQPRSQSVVMPSFAFSPDPNGPALREARPFSFCPAGCETS